MDQKLFQDDWTILSSDFLQIVTECFGLEYSQLAAESEFRLEAQPMSADWLFEKLENWTNLSMQKLMRVQGLQLELFSLLQQTHKSKKFFFERQENTSISPTLSWKIKEKRDCTLDFWIGIGNGQVTNIYIEDLMQQSFHDLFHYRTTHIDKPLSREIRHVISSRMKALLKSDLSPQKLSFAQMVERVRHQISASFYPSWSMLDLKNIHQSGAQFTISMILDPGIHDLKECITVMQNLPQRMHAIKQTRLETLDLKIKNLQAHSPECDKIKYEIQQINQNNISFYLKISAKLIVHFLEIIFQKVYQKKLRKIVEQSPSDLVSIKREPFLENIKTLRKTSSLGSQYFFELLDIFRTLDQNCVIGLLAGDLREAYELSILTWMSALLFEKPLAIIPAMEHPSAIANVCNILDQTQVILRRIGFSFHETQFDKVLIGYQHHLKDKSFWWVQTQLYHAQNDLIDWASMRGRKITIIQSRGGSLARGSLPTRCLMNTTTFHDQSYHLAFLVQYDGLRQRLNTPQISAMTIMRYLEELIGVAAKKTQAVCRMDIQKGALIRTLQKSLAAHSLPEVEYYSTEQPDLIDYFYAVTPADFLQKQRPDSLMKQYRIEDIDVTLWFGSWSQCRLLLPLWLGIASILTQWGYDSSDHRLTLKDDLFTQSLFIVTLISINRVDLGILRLYEKELLSPHLREMGEFLQERYQKVLNLFQKSVDFHQEDAYVKNFGDDIRHRNRQLRLLHCLQIEFLRRARLDGLNSQKYTQFIEESAFLIGLGLQNSV